MKTVTRDRVADASALAAIAFRESRADELAKVLDGATLHAPAILAFELTNTAWKKTTPSAGFSRGRRDTAREHSDPAIDIVPADPVEVLHLASATSLTAYDAAYLWVAHRLAAPLVTLDRRLETVARGWGYLDGGRSTVLT